MSSSTSDDAHPSETLGMASMSFAVADRDSALAPAGTALSSATADVPLTADSAAPAAGKPGRGAPGSGRLMSSRTAYSSRICALHRGWMTCNQTGCAHNTHSHAHAMQLGRFKEQATNNLSPLCGV